MYLLPRWPSVSLNRIYRLTLSGVISGSVVSFQVPLSGVDGTVRWFPMAAVISCHNLSDLQQHVIMTSQFFWFEVWCGFQWPKIKVSAGLRPFLEALGKNLFLAFFQFLGDPPIPWLVAIYSFKTSNTAYFWPFFCSQTSHWPYLGTFLWKGLISLHWAHPDNRE